MTTPFALLARKVTVSYRMLRQATTTMLVLSVVIVITGGAVRLTGSGLGCPDWPTCNGSQLVPTAAMGIHGAIEFTNRMMAWVVSAGVGWAILAARLQPVWRRSLTRLGWAGFWVVMGNAVVGGITVLTGLSPYVVMAHFLLSVALLAVAVAMWQRAREGDGPPRPLVPVAARQLAWILVGVALALITVGTVVTGAGPHAGDSSDVPRIPVNWIEVAHLHASLAYLTTGLTVATLLALRALGATTAAHRARDLLVVLLSQAAIGYVQYFTGLPEIVVGMHLLGACLVWIAALRVPLALRERPVTGAEQASPATTGEVLTSAS